MITLNDRLIIIYVYNLAIFQFLSRSTISTVLECRRVLDSLHSFFVPNDMKGNDCDLPWIREENVDASASFRSQNCSGLDRSRLSSALSSVTKQACVGYNQYFLKLSWFRACSGDGSYLNWRRNARSSFGIIHGSKRFNRHSSQIPAKFSWSKSGN